MLDPASPASSHVLGASETATGAHGQTMARPGRRFDIVFPRNCVIFRCPSFVWTRLVQEQELAQLESGGRGTPPELLTSVEPATAWERFQSATLSLARSGPIKDRLADAYRNHLAEVREEELPR